MSGSQLLALNLASSSGLFVLILLVQLLIYPSFRKVSEPEFPEYHRFHCTRIAYVVGPLLIVDGLVSVSLIFTGHSGVFINGVLCLFPIVATALFYAPLHGLIEKRNSSRLIDLLIVHNNWRVLMWGAKFSYSLMLIRGIT